MQQLRRRLPPVNSLVIFEAAGRHLNFTRAGEELGLTQSAVSRQVQLLEDHLGAALFQRRGRTLVLTRDGARLHGAVTMGLDHIAGVAVDIRRHRGQGELIVATSVTFASYWLMGRLAKFRAAYPEIELKLVASTRIHELMAAEVDIAIRYGTGQWEGLEAIRIFDNEIWPVCAPSYLAGRPPPEQVAGLLGETLLHLGQFDRNWVTWQAWLGAQGVTASPAKRGLEFDNYLVLLQAAIRGEGVALCGRRLAEDFIARGDLVRPIEAALRSDRAFYLLYPDGSRLSPAAEKFRDWVIAEAA
ncbi:MAG TPA: LysR substrate-binding domain-containing protein [Geminicoccaceae bacterium]|nr:LysR substrate-binding domain-containing protein [Geminicoccaceae bacterium]